MEASMQLKRLVEIALRRKWWIVVPVLLTTAAGFLAFEWAPKTYRATTTILVSRDRVPEDIVHSTVTLRIEERMRSLALQVGSRAYLEPAARKLGMIPAGADEASIEDACDRLRKRVIPELDSRDFSWFRISVDDTDPNRAAGLANALAGRFIEENSVIRASQAKGTLEMTASWEEGYRQTLSSNDERIAEFKRRNLHDLPDQQPANAQFLVGAENTVLRLTNEIRSLTLRLESLRAQQAIPLGGTPKGGETRRATLERELSELQASYTDANPLVTRKRAQLAELVATLPPPPAREGPTPADPGIATIEYQIGELQRDRARANADVDTYRGRIRNAQLLQPELLALTRGYDQAKAQLDLAVSQNEKAQNSQDIESAKTGEQFQIQDRALPPDAPYSPNFGVFVLTGLGLGLAFGMAASAAREFVDQTVRGEQEFVSHFPDLPVYGVIPSLAVARAQPGGSDRRLA